MVDKLSYRDIKEKISAMIRKSLPVRQAGVKSHNPIKSLPGRQAGVIQTIKDKIFQPFFTTKPTGSGTGLGLSLSYDIIKSHGGTLKIEKREEVGLPAGQAGSTFIILIPTI